MGAACLDCKSVVTCAAYTFLYHDFCCLQMSAQEPILLGVDGGATKTACTALLASTQEQLAQAYAGPSNWYSLQSPPQSYNYAVIPVCTIKTSVISTCSFFGSKIP